MPHHWIDQPRDEAGKWTDTGGAETTTIKDAGGALRMAASDNYGKKMDLRSGFTPNPHLNEVQKEIEARFIADLEENFFQREQEYLTNRELSGDHGNIVSADNAKELSPDYAKDNQSRAELAAAVHEPASIFIKKVYERLLERTPKSGLVVFTGGGTGAGKTTAIKNLADLQTMADKADVVYDSNLSSYGSAKKKIDDALNSGRDVTIFFVHREIEDAFKNGVIPRMERVGRSVPITEHIQRTSDAFKTTEKLDQTYKSNNKVNVRYIDNSNGIGRAKQVSLEVIREKAYLYDTGKIEKDLNEYTKKLYESGKITKKQFIGLTTKTG